MFHVKIGQKNSDVTLFYKVEFNLFVSLNYYKTKDFTHIMIIYLYYFFLLLSY